MGLVKPSRPTSQYVSSTPFPCRMATSRGSGAMGTGGGDNRDKETVGGNSHNKGAIEWAIVTIKR